MSKIKDVDTHKLKTTKEEFEGLLKKACKPMTADKPSPESSKT